MANGDLSAVRWPHPLSVASGIFAGNRMHEMNLAQTRIVKDCVYEAIRNSQDRDSLLHIHNTTHWRNMMKQQTRRLEDNL